MCTQITLSVSISSCASSKIWSQLNAFDIFGLFFRMYEHTDAHSMASLKVIDRAERLCPSHPDSPASLAILALIEHPVV